MMLETAPKLVFDEPGARIFWGWADYQRELGGSSLSRASLAASRAPNLGVTLGALGVTFGALRVTFGALRVTLGALRVTFGPYC